MSKQINVTLYCPTCGLSDFYHDEDKSYIKCNNCEREFHGGLEEVLEYNQKQVDEALEQESEKLLNDFGKTLENQFKNNVHFKFKK